MRGGGAADERSVDNVLIDARVRSAVGALLLSVALVCGTSPARAQTPPGGTANPTALDTAVARRPTPWLPAEHWTRSVLVRLHARGAANVDPVPWLRTQAEAEEALRAGHGARLAAERAVALPASRVHMEGAVVFVTRHDALRPAGYTLDRAWTGPQAVRDAATGGVRLRAAAVPRSWLAVTTELMAAERRAVVQHATVDVALGPVDVWAGRRAIGYRPGAAGGLVLSGTERFDGAGVRLGRPVRVPLVGSFSAEAFAGPLGSNGHVARPWLLGMRLHARLHPRVDMGATRAAVFGSMGDTRVGVSELAQVIVGANLDGDFADDQVASLDARWRPPLGVLVEIYGEWGMHDIDVEVLIDVPAFTVGARLPRLVRLPDGSAGLGLEHTQISASCCGNPPWYQHFELADGWATDGGLLGHPLGGHGREWRVTLDADGADGTVVLHAAAALRTRSAENLFAPARQGRAALYELGADAHLADRISADLRLLVERGSGWREVHSAAAVRWRF